MFKVAYQFFLETGLVLIYEADKVLSRSWCQFKPLGNCPFCELSRIKILFHVEKLHGNHADGKTAPLNFVFFAQIIHIAGKAVIQNGSGEIWICTVL